MLVAMDVDGTIDSDPQVFQGLAAALIGAGCEVAVLTGISGVDTVTPADVKLKQEYLQQLGFASYTHLAVFPDGPDLPFLKAQWCKDHGAAMLIDNNRANAEAAQNVCLVLVPWQTRMGKKKHGVAKATVRIVSKDQPRDEDGRFASGGGGDAKVGRSRPQPGSETIDRSGRAPSAAAEAMDHVDRAIAASHGGAAGRMEAAGHIAAAQAAIPADHPAQESLQSAADSVRGGARGAEDARASLGDAYGTLSRTAD